MNGSLALRAAEHWVDDGNFDRPALDRLERHVPCRGARQCEARHYGAAQTLVLHIRNRCEYQHSPTGPPKKSLRAAKSPYDAAKTP